MASRVASPCIDICRIERATQLCEGCARTMDEIVRWPAASDEEKRAILVAVARRKGRSAR